MKSWILCFYHDQRAVTAIEYALLAALIAVVIVGAVTTVGSQLQLLYGSVKDKLVAAVQ